jgi:hypothetical protein
MMKEEKKLRIEKDALKFTLREKFAAFWSLIRSKPNCLPPTVTDTSTLPSEVLL